MIMDLIAVRSHMPGLRCWACFIIPAPSAVLLVIHFFDSYLIIVNEMLNLIIME